MAVYTSMDKVKDELKRIGGYHLIIRKLAPNVEQLKVIIEHILKQHLEPQVLIITFKLDQTGYSKILFNEVKKLIDTEHDNWVACLCLLEGDIDNLLEVTRDIDGPDVNKDYVIVHINMKANNLGYAALDESEISDFGQ